MIGIFVFKRIIGLRFFFKTFSKVGIPQYINVEIKIFVKKNIRIRERMNFLQHRQATLLKIQFFIKT